MMDPRPLAQRLAESLLPVPDPLPEFVRSRRCDGVPWRLISREIWDLTKVDIGEQTLKQWYPDPPRTGDDSPAEAQAAGDEAAA